MKNEQITELLNENQWAKEQFDTHLKLELEAAGFKIVKGTGKWGKSAKIVVRDQKGFDRIASGENGEIGYPFIAECVRLVDRWKAVQELEKHYAQMALLGWHCDPVFDMVKSFSFTMHDGSERTVPLTLLNIYKLTEEMEIRIRAVRIVEIYPQMTEFGWEVDFTNHQVRIEDDEDTYGYTENKKKYLVFDYWKEEDYEELIRHFDKVMELMA